MVGDKLAGNQKEQHRLQSDTAKIKKLRVHPRDEMKLLRKYRNGDTGANGKVANFYFRQYMRDWEGTALLKEADGPKESKLFMCLRTASGKLIQYLHIHKEKSGSLIAAFVPQNWSKLSSNLEQ